MTKKNRVLRLSHYHNEEHPIVSFYLNLTSPRELSSRVNSLVRGKIKELRNGSTASKYTQQERDRLEQLLKRMEEQVLNREGSFKNTRLLALFADTQGYWEEFELPVSHPSTLEVAPSPHMRPLLVLQEQFPLFCVVVTDSFQARMFSYSGGMMSEKSDIFSVEEIQPARDEANHGFGEQRYQRYIKDHSLRHIKHTADTIFEQFQDGNYDYLIVGSSDRGSVNLLKDNLHSYLRKCLIGEINANPENDWKVIKSKVEETAAAWEQNREKEMVESVLENAYSNGKAVLGTGPSIKALMNGQVHTLLVRPDVKKEGYFCPNDHFLSLKSQKCPVCGEDLRKSENIIDEMVEETIAQKGEVTHLFNYAHKIEENETAALLRFVV